jgi:hypothetical protein
MITNRSLMTASLCTFFIARAVLAQDSGMLGEDGTIFAQRRGAVQEVHQSFAGPGALDVAIVAAAANDVSSLWFTEPRDALLSSGFFSSVTVIDAGQVTPSLNELLVFDAVLVWSNLALGDPTLLGENLAKYVNRGGGVVVAVFATSSSTSGRSLAGRWATHGYEIVPAASGNMTGSATLGAVLQAAHPTVLGLTSFAGGSLSFRPTTPVVFAPGEVIARWSDGSTLVASREDTVGARVDLGFYPPSDDVDAIAGNYWDPSTDGSLLLVNAVKFATERAPLSTGDSNGDGLVDETDLAKFDLCFGGEGVGPPTAGCAVFDSNLDDDVDCLDWAQLIATWNGAGSLPPDTFSCIQAVPTVSEYGVIALGLLLLSAGVVIVKRTQAIE